MHGNGLSVTCKYTQNHHIQFGDPFLMNDRVFLRISFFKLSTTAHEEPKEYRTPFIISAKLP